MMVPSNIGPEELIALFAARASAPSPETSHALARHLQCKESIALVRIIAEAISQHASGNQSLHAPTEMLPPLA